MFSFLILPKLFCFSHLIRAAAAAQPAFTNAPQLLQLTPVQQPNRATVSSPNNTSPNRFWTWNIPNTRYDIYMIASPPIVPTLPIVALSEVYILAINECHVKIAQGLGGHSAENVTFTAQDVELKWAVPATGGILNYSMLLLAFSTLVDLNVRQNSPLPELFAKDLSFTVAHRNERRYMGNGRVGFSQDGSEVLAKRSWDSSPTPQLLQPLTSQRGNTTTSLSFNTTDPDTVYEYDIPSTPYVLVVQTYSLYSLLQLEALEEVYNRTLTDFQEEIAQGHGGSTPQSFSVVYSPVQLIWRADIVWGGLNYSMLSIVFGALKQLHTDPAPALRAIFRKMIYYDVFEQIKGQRFELGGGRVDSTEPISKRQTVNPVHDNFAYQILSTPYNLLVTSYTDEPVMPETLLEEVYFIAISALEDEIAQGHGSTKPADLTFKKSFIELIWTRSDEGTGLNYTDLLKVFEALESLHMNRETPWHSRQIWYSIALPNAEQRLAALGGGSIEDWLAMGASNVSVQNFKRNLVKPINTLPSYVCHLPNTPYVLNIRAVPSIIEPQLPLGPLIAIYDLAYHDFEDEIRIGHGGDVPLKFDIVLRPFALNWQREDPPGLNYSMLLRVYQLLETLQVDEATPFPQGYRRSLLFRVVTMSDEFVGSGKVIG